MRGPHLARVGGEWVKVISGYEISPYGGQWTC